MILELIQIIQPSSIYQINDATFQSKPIILESLMVAAIELIWGEGRRERAST
jgi:hypothetical protein